MGGSPRTLSASAVSRSLPVIGLPIVRGLEGDCDINDWIMKLESDDDVVRDGVDGVKKLA